MHNMNPILLNFADGTAFFVGIGFVIVAVLLLLYFRNTYFRSALVVFVVVSIVVVMISATPLPLWGYAVWLVALVAFLLVSNHARSSQRIKALLAGMVVLVSIALCLTEAPYHRSPQVIVPKGATIYVLGDSITAQMGPWIRSWPAVLNELSRKAPGQKENRETSTDHGWFPSFHRSVVLAATATAQIRQGRRSLAGSDLVGSRDRAYPRTRVP